MERSLAGTPIMAPLISIIIPVYNHAQELLACLDSIEEQTYRNIEVIIVDDASLEPVANALQDKILSFQYELIRLEQNQDAPRARNEGFKRSHGDYVLFLDADIVLRPHTLECMMTALQKNPSAAFVYSSFYFGWKLFQGQSFNREALFKTNYIHTSSLLRRSWFPEFDPQFKKFQDWDLWLTIAVRGGEGVWLEEPLFTVAPRRTGKSHWLPKIAYRIPWPVFGYAPRVIRRYREAEAQIRAKHPAPSLESAQSSNPLPLGIPQEAPTPVCLPREGGDPAHIDPTRILGWLAMIFVLECFSAWSIFSPARNSALALLAAVVVGIVAMFRPLWAISFLSAEFIIGSKGGLLKYGADVTNNGGINFRVLIFVAFMGGWALNALYTRSWKNWKLFLKQRWIYLLLAATLAFAFLRGWMLGQRTFLIADANAWGVWLLLLPVMDIAYAKAQKWREVFLPAIIAATFWMCLETVLLFYFFSHGFFDAVGPVYYWVRRTGIGEMTKVLPDISIYRIFFQSHIYAACAALGLFVGSLYGYGKKKWITALHLLALMTVLVSLSRSLWIGVATAYVFSCLYVWLLNRFTPQKKTLFWKRALLTEFLLGILACVLAGFIAWVPFPISQPSSLLQVIESRTDTQEDAAQSRWELLPVLMKKIQEHPFLGSGFGSTVTYRSHDPRLVEAKQKTYTTFAVEWGWLEFWMKFGLIGIPLIAGLLLVLYWRVRRSLLPVSLVAVIASIFVLLAATHMFTPYLNHPLGFFLLLCVEAMLTWSTSQSGMQKKAC